MNRALVLTSLCVYFVTAIVVADEPASSERDSGVRSEEKSGKRRVVRPTSRRTPARVPTRGTARNDRQGRQEKQRPALTPRPHNVPAVSRKRDADRQRRMESSRGPVNDVARSKTPPGRKGRSRQTDEHSQPVRSKKSDSAANGKSGQTPRKSKRNSPDQRADSRRTGKQSTQRNRNRDAAEKADPVSRTSRESELPLIVPRSVRAPSYAAVRATIPFSRSEWAADPSYRHNGTMELILGQLRDLVVYQSPPGAQQGPGLSPGSGITINNGGGYPGYYGFGGIPFGFNPGTNGAAQSRAIINSFQTHGFIGRGAPVLP